MTADVIYTGGDIVTIDAAQPSAEAVAVKDGKILALKAITVDAAQRYFEAHTKGSIEVGKLANLVILDRNPLTVDPMDIKNISVLETIKEGRTIYAAGAGVLCRRYAKHLAVTVASVDYRLAPEHPYPASLEDCYSALTWLGRLPAVDSNRLAIGGASAGGGLAAVLALLTRDRGEIGVAAQLLVYPMLDDRTVERKHLDNPGHRFWNQSSNKYGWMAYLGEADREIAVPARRKDLTGLPPTWLGVGTLDLFHDEDVVYAQKLKAAGVPCKVEVVKGAFHGFDGIVPKATVSQAFFDSQIELLREAFTRGAA